jgi:hypothetical protein
MASLKSPSLIILNPPPNPLKGIVSLGNRFPVAAQFLN